MSMPQRKSKIYIKQQSSMAATTSNMQATAETIPQIAMFISESAQPHPAPLPPLPPPQSVLPPATAPPPPPASLPPRHALSLQPIQAQQLPPPPAPTPSVVQLRPVATTYPAMQPPQTTPVLFTTNQPLPMVPTEFDASRPPPPIPTHLHNNNNVQLKRRIDADRNAATTKLRKQEGSEVVESLCENCVQREIRIDGYKQQMESLHNEEETQILLYKKKLQKYEIGKDILKTIVGPELFVVFDNLIEGTQTPPLDNPDTSFMSGSSTVSMQTVLQFFKMLHGGSARNVEPVPSTSRVDDNLQSLTSLTRRINVANYASPGPDLIKFVMETLRNSSAPDRTSSVEELPIEPAGMSGSNGYMANGQKGSGGGMGETARFGYAAAGAQSQDYGARALPSYSGAGPSAFAAAAPVPALPNAYPMFNPVVPPPPIRQNYPPSAAVPGPSNASYNGAERASGPGPSQGMPPTTSAAVRPSQANAPTYNYTGMYPQPPFFPPYQ